MKQFKNIIFDLGNVLVSLDLDRCLSAFHRLDVADVGGLMGSTAFRQLIDDTEVGLIDEHECIRQMRQIGHITASDAAIAAAWNALLVEISDERKQRLLQLHERYSVFLLSNTNALHWHYCADRLFPMGQKGVDDYFDRVFLSYEMHLAKPSPAIFTEALRQAGIRADETLFIDDREENCVAAQQIGLKTYHNHQINDWTHEDHLFE
jgi:FMN phosphatase YigB (HAD superfamily)